LSEAQVHLKEKKRSIYTGATANGEGIDICAGRTIDTSGKFRFFLMRLGHAYHGLMTLLSTIK
jgi:hypothetical protein